MLAHCVDERKDERRRKKGREKRCFLRPYICTFVETYGLSQRTLCLKVVSYVSCNDVDLADVAVGAAYMIGLLSSIKIHTPFLSGVPTSFYQHFVLVLTAFPTDIIENSLNTRHAFQNYHQAQQSAVHSRPLLPLLQLLRELCPISTSASLTASVCRPAASLLCSKTPGFTLCQVP